MKVFVARSNRDDVSEQMRTARQQQPRFLSPRSTASEPREAPSGMAQPPSDAVVEEQRIVRWLNSEASRPYEGRWVALGLDESVVAVVDSPREMPEDVMRRTDLAVVFVLPRGIAIAG